MGPKLQCLDWIWMFCRWIINVVVRFVFCLALPEVIHLPRGLEAVTRNWRNHDSTELSAPQSLGEESDGAHCSTKRWEHFPIYFFYGAFFFSSIPLNNSRSPSPSIFSGFQSVFHSAVLVNFLKKIVISKDVILSKRQRGNLELMLKSDGVLTDQDKLQWLSSRPLTLATTCAFR